MRAEQAAKITNAEGLPERLRQPVAKLLAEYGRKLAADGYDSARIARVVTDALQLIALAEPEECPSLADLLDPWWPPMTNFERRAWLRRSAPPPRKHNLDPALHRTNQTAVGRLALGGRHAEEESPRGDPQETEE